MFSFFFHSSSSFDLFVKHICMCESENISYAFSQLWINKSYMAYLIFIILAVWFVLINVLLCVCSSSHVHLVALWLLCGRTDWKTGKWREMQKSIHWHQLNSVENEKHSMIYVAVYVMCLLYCFLCVVLKELLIILLWDPCFLHDTCESLFEMNLSYGSALDNSIVCWYVHWSCWECWVDQYIAGSIWRGGGKERN